MKRPVGYAILAGIVAIMSVTGVFAFFSLPQSPPPFQITIPPLFYVLIAVQVVLGAAAAWSLWIYHRNAAELFLAWLLIGFVSSLYSAWVMVPQMLRALTAMMPAGMTPPVMPNSMTVSQIVFEALLGAGAYWYLLTRRRPRTLAASQVTATPSSP